MQKIIKFIIHLISIAISFFVRKKYSILVLAKDEFKNSFFFGNQSNNLSLIISYINENNLFKSYNFNILSYSNIGAETKHLINIRPNIKIKYCKDPNKCNFWEFINSTFVLSYYLYTSKFILGTNPYVRDFFKGSKQKYIIFNYYSPFKADKSIDKPFCKIDYLFSSSDFFSKYIAKSVDVEISNVMNVGFPRIDTLLNNKQNRSDVLSSIGISFSPSKVLIYAPTHRGFWGNSFSSESLDSIFNLTDLLVDSNTALIIFLHPENEKELSSFPLPKNIFLGKNTYPYTLYNFLAISDALISDYSSLHFDYLFINKPIFYFFLDYHKFIEVRGFAYDNFLELCKGSTSFDIDQLHFNLSEYLKKGIDVFKSERTELSTLINNNYSSSYIKKNVEHLMKILN